MTPLAAKDWPQIVRPGSRVFIGSNAACPHALIRSMLSAHHLLRDIELVHILTLGPTPWVDAPYRDVFRVNSFFLGPGIRDAVNSGHGDYTPAYLSDIPSLFLQRTLPLDVALIQVSPPDEDGFCSFGLSVDVVSAASRSAQVIVAQVNSKMPRTFGDTLIHQDRIDFFLEAAEEPTEHTAKPASATSNRIGRNVAQLIDDGSTLQLGIGRLPDAVCDNLMGHRHLGIHTEMLGDGAMRLFTAGVVDNSRKSLHPGQIVTSFCMGSAKLYQQIANNPYVTFFPTEYTNNPVIIARNDRMVSINSALQVDITGQIAPDSLGERFYSGIGGNVDFMRGARMSRGGMAIIAVPSTANDHTVSRIVPHLYEATGMVATRADVSFIVTEYGIASLQGRSIRERVLELIGVAHPDHRENLLREARRRKLIPASQAVPLMTDDAIAGVSFQRIALREEPYVLRPMMPSDERRLQEFFYSHTQETIKARYGYSITRMSRERAQQLCGVDQTNDLALGIFELKGPRQLLHAIGRYYLDKDTNSGEMAFVVREEKRRHGMASHLLKRMLEVARQRKLSSLWALVSRENHAMATMLLRQGGVRSTHPDDPASTCITFSL